jgi:hypothetical protein
MVTTVAGVTAVGLSQALNTNAISAAENMIEYFMTISSQLLNRAARLKCFSAMWNYNLTILIIRLGFCSSSHTVRIFLGTI